MLEPDTEVPEIVTLFALALKPKAKNSTATANFEK
jgi:hypothetical protein